MVFQFGNTIPQLLERFVGLELRVSLHNHEERLQSVCQHVLGLHLLLIGAGLAGHGARLDNGLESLLFMLHVAFADLDQLGQFIVALLEQDIDIAPVALNIVFKRDKPVVDSDDIYD